MIWWHRFQIREDGSAYYLYHITSDVHPRELFVGGYRWLTDSAFLVYDPDKQVWLKRVILPGSEYGVPTKDEVVSAWNAAQAS